MKKLSVKNVVLTVLQVPVVLAQLLLACVELLLLKCVARLSNPLSNPIADLAGPAESCSACQEPESSEARERNVLDLKFLWRWLSRQDDAFIEHCRIRLETTGIGPGVVSKNSGCHLYGVLRPNRLENLLRIKNVLYAMDSQVLEELIVEAKRLLSK